MDEVGRGPLAGPVVAAAVVFCRVGDLAELSLPGLDDSKRVPAVLRDRLTQQIRAVAAGVGVGWADVGEIDRHNIRQAALLAMQRAVAALSVSPDFLLVDGRDLPGSLPCPARAVVGGDALSASIAAASVCAKVHRDQWMTQLASCYPGYGWERNCGYPTREHLEALSRLGPCPEHRRSFAPVRRFFATG